MEVLIKIFVKKKFECSERQIYGLIHTQDQENWVVLKKELVNPKMDIKNVVSLHEGSQTHYESLHRILEKNISSAPKVKSMGKNTHKKLEN